MSPSGFLCFAVREYKLSDVLHGFRIDAANTILIDRVQLRFHLATVCMRIWNNSVLVRRDLMKDTDPLQCW